MEYQLRKTGEQVWIDGNYRNLKEEIMAEGYEYRLKPAAPKWPHTTMTHGDLSSAYGNMVMEDPLRDVANAALAHACESSQVVPADKVREIEAKARAEGVKDGLARNEGRDRYVAEMALQGFGVYACPEYIGRLMKRLSK